MFFVFMLIIGIICYIEMGLLIARKIVTPRLLKFFGDSIPDEADFFLAFVFGLVWPAYMLWAGSAITGKYLWNKFPKTKRLSFSKALTGYTWDEIQ